MSAAGGILARFRSHRFEKFLKHTLSKLLGFFVSHERVARVPLDSIRNILVIRQHNQLGDMLCAVPLLRALRQRLPNAFLGLVASPVNYEVMLHNPFVDDVILYDKLQFSGSPIRFIQFYRKLREKRYDLAIVPSTVSMSFTSDSMAYLCGAKYRVGTLSINGIENIAAHFFNIPLDLNWDESQHIHQTERNLEFVRCLGMDTNDLSSVIELTEEEKKFAEDLLYDKIKGRKHIVGFHPGAGKPPNRWPAERFAQVADKLVSELDALIVVTAGPMDDEPVERMIQSIKTSCLVVKEKSIRKVAAIIDRLDLFVTNDTGVMHVAGGTRTSVLSLFGPSDPYQWAPKGSRHKFLVSQNHDIKSIAVDGVYSSARQLLIEQ